MSILTATHDDFTPRGGALPPGMYRVTVEQAGPEPAAQGTQFLRVYANIRTREGATEFANNGGTFRIGNRKLFVRSWIDHTNPRAVAAGKAQIAREAAACGFMQKPEKGQAVELPFDSWEEYAGQLAGRELLVKVVNEVRKNKVTKQPEKDDNGDPLLDARVTDWLPA